MTDLMRKPDIRRHEVSVKESEPRPGAERLRHREDQIGQPARSSPLDWVRARRAERDIRRAAAAHERLARRMDTLGNEWRVLDLKAVTGFERTSFLTVGPGGVFAVTVKEHGRNRVNFAGDIVQIDGRRPKYVEEAREYAALAAEALSRRARVKVPVMPVLAFAGTGMISFYGVPKGCIVTSYESLSNVLNSRGLRLAPETVDKLFAIALHPATWINPPYQALAERYTWYPEGGSATQKTA
jgi:hypothetical protein